MITERINQLRKIGVEPKYHCSERARLWTESYKNTEGKSRFMRQAEALKYTLDNLGLAWIPIGGNNSNKSSSESAPGKH